MHKTGIAHLVQELVLASRQSASRWH